MWLTPAQLTVREGAQQHPLLGARRVHRRNLRRRDQLVAVWRRSLNRPEDRTFVHATASPNPLVTWGSGAVGAMDVAPKTGVPHVQLGGRERPDRRDHRAGAPQRRPPRVGRPWAGRSGTPKVTLEPIAGPGVLRSERSRTSSSSATASSPRSDRNSSTWRAMLVKKLHSSTPGRARSTSLKDRINYFAAFRVVARGRNRDAEPRRTAFRRPGPGRQRRSTWRSPGLGGDDCRPHDRGAAHTGHQHAFLLNELDTAFGAVLGERPRAERVDEMRTASPLPPRDSDEDDFDDFLGALEYPAAESDRPALEAQGHGRGRDPRALPDRSLRGRELDAHRQRTRAYRTQEKRPRTHHLPDPGCQRTRCHINRGRARAGHRPGPHPVDREGGRRGTTGGPRARPLLHARRRVRRWRARCPRASHEEIETLANVQARTPDPLPPGAPRRGLLNAAGNLRRGHIKWRWPRLAQGSDVLSGAPHRLSRPRRGHRLPLSAGHRSRLETSCDLRTHPLPDLGGVSTGCA